MSPSTTSCGFPLRQLRPGGVLVTWQNCGPPAVRLGPSEKILVGGEPATHSDTRRGMCKSIGADPTIDVSVETSPLPSNVTEFTACLRGPGLARAEKNVDALLESTRFRSN